MLLKLIASCTVNRIRLWRKRSVEHSLIIRNNNNIIKKKKLYHRIEINEE